MVLRGALRASRNHTYVCPAETKNQLTINQEMGAFDVFHGTEFGKLSKAPAPTNGKFVITIEKLHA
jgi:hypothetical protein